MTEIHGTCDPRFQGVCSLLEKYIKSGEEVGASITIDIDGKEVVDIWGGYADKERTKPWEKDTIVNVFSCTKTITSLAVLMLVDRGLIDVNERVSHYWPEFGQNGKQDVLVRHLLSHTSGVSGWEEPISPEDMYDVDKAAAMLARQAPWWTPGTASGYQAVCFGHLLGELIKRVSGKSLREFVDTEIAGVLDADFQIGAAENTWDRISPLIPPPSTGVMPEFEEGSVRAKTLLNPPFDPSFANTGPWRQAELGGSNGHGNSRSMARMLSAITLSGSSQGKKLLSEDTIKLIFQEQANGKDLVLGSSLRFGIGFGLAPSPALPWVPEGNVCYWSGWGGSIIIMDLDRRMTIAYAMNKMGGGLDSSDRAEAYGKAIYQAFEN
ncbi:beta-lactamase [Fusarium mexicanum]|uniref:Beta-lactamase n=1 Tax=Fusarium mexicanum TaxID=751941 RepID=A0A8H5IG28_9HYPO|nr:beta-lactamase [Fusarium mexicanum]